MPYKKKVRELMIPLQDYPHIPHWFTLRQAVAMVRESALKYAGTLQPHAVLVFNEKYQIVGMLTLRDILKGLEPGFLKESEIIKADPTLAIVMEDLFGPGMKKQAERPVSEAMSPIKASIQADDSLVKALFTMVKEKGRPDAGHRWQPGGGPGAADVSLPGILPGHLGQNRG